MNLAVKILIWIGVGVVALLAVPAGFLASGAYKNFYIPSEAMRPTFEVGDRFVARMGVREALRRGDIVLVATSDGSIYVKRVAGISGDRLALHGGIVHINGQPAAQRLVGVEQVERDELSPFGDRWRRLSEQFPGEAAPHEIYDAGDSVGDEFAELRIAPGHIFLLGDNRDLSADSRFSVDEQGLGGQVPISRVRGVPAFFTRTAAQGARSFGEDASH